MMKTYLRFLPVSAAALFTVAAASAQAGGEGWTHDFAAAKAQAAKENKNLLIDFTGSDWCGWCIKLREEVFEHDAFKNGVKDTFVLVELDYPRDTSKLSPETIEQNDQLKNAYAIRGYPTIFLTDAAGKPFAKTGYQRGGPEAYVAHLNDLSKAKSTRDQAFAKAERQDGVDKAETLSAALQALDLEDSQVMALYGDVVASIKQADPTDTSDFAGRIERNARFAEVEGELSKLYRSSEHDDALKLVADTLADGAFEGEQKQTLMLIQGLVLHELERKDEALAMLDAAEKVAPGSPMARNIQAYRERFQENPAPGAE